MKAALARDRIILFSDGRAMRAYCYVTNAVTAMWDVLFIGGAG
jgi:hypothetical protein